MTVYDDPDARVVELNRRARLMREAAAFVPPGRMRNALHVEAQAVAAEAMMIVVEEGAQHGEAYYHEVDSGLLCLGSAIPARAVETAQPGGEAL